MINSIFFHMGFQSKLWKVQLDFFSIGAFGVNFEKFNSTFFEFNFQNFFFQLQKFNWTLFEFNSQLFFQLQKFNFFSIGAFGEFEVTDDISQYCKAAIFNKVFIYLTKQDIQQGTLIENIITQSRFVKIIGEKSRNVWINSIMLTIPVIYFPAICSYKIAILRFYMNTLLGAKYLALLNLNLFKHCGFFLL